MEMSSDEKAKLFFQTQNEITDKFIEMYPKDAGSQTLLEIIKKFPDDIGLWEKFVEIILPDPVAFRAVFIVNTLPEEFDLRTKLSQLSPLIESGIKR